MNDRPYTLYGRLFILRAAYPRGQSYTLPEESAERLELVHNLFPVSLR